MRPRAMDYASHRNEEARRLAQTSPSPGDLAARTGLTFEEAWKIWHGTIQLESIREKRAYDFNATD